MQRNLIVAGLIAAVSVSSAFAAKDKFNRANLGSKWVVTDGTLSISNNQLVGDALALGYYKKSQSDEQASVVAKLGGTDTEYAAIALGDIAGGNNAFIKIQSQNGTGTFDTAGFYVGNNGGGNFFTLDAPVASPATMTVAMSGTVATLTIKSSSGTQSYQYDYGASYGSGAGLGTYGAIALDNFKSVSVAEEAVQPRIVTTSNAVDRSR